MLIIKEIDFTQRKVIGLETDGELIEVSLTETKLKLVFSKENIVVEKEIEKVKDEDKLFDVIAEEDVKEEVKEVSKKQKQTTNFIKNNTIQEKPLKGVLEASRTLDTTFQEVYSCIDDVYNNFNIDNMYELLTTKEDEIISYIEKKHNNNNFTFQNDSFTIQRDLVYIGRCYKLLKIDCELLRNKIGEYNIVLEEEETNKVETIKQIETYIKSIQEE